MAKSAKAGDKISAKASAKLRKSDPHGHFFPGVSGRMPEAEAKEWCTVAPKSTGDHGQWVCIDCGELPQNNMMAQSHASSHRVAWRNADNDGRLEEP